MPSLVPAQPEVEQPQHRKNAAEWLLWTLLLPLVPIAWMIEWISRRRSEV